jgi:hypothetical protein
MTEQAEVAQPAQADSRTSYMSSVIALVLGLGLAVAVSTLFSVIGWGGELASQTAGAASGAAPLILDGVRQRRLRGRRHDLMALSRGRQVAAKIGVASLFGFAVLFVDSMVGYAIVQATEVAIRVSGGDEEKWVQASVALTGLVVVPIVLAATLLLALAAGHRLGEHRKRWILFGIAIYGVLRVLHVSLAGMPVIADLSPALVRVSFVISAVLITGLLAGVALIGAAWARKTQPVFNATAFFRRLPDEDQQAALALLGDAVAARTSVPPVSRPT